MAGSKRQRSGDGPPAAPKHKELTPKQAQALSDQAFKLERAIVAASAKVHGAWWELSELLYEFHENGYWRVLGYTTLDEFLAQPELGIKRTTFFQMTKVWRDLVIVREVQPDGLKEIEPSKVVEVTPAIMRGDVKVEDALDDAKALGRRDLREKYRPEKQAKHGQAPDDSTPLDAEAEPELVQCEACGSWYAKPEEDEDEGE